MPYRAGGTLEDADAGLVNGRVDFAHQLLLDVIGLEREWNDRLSIITPTSNTTTTTTAAAVAGHVSYAVGAAAARACEFKSGGYGKWVGYVQSTRAPNCAAWNRFGWAVQFALGACSLGLDG